MAWLNVLLLSAAATTVLGAIQYDKYTLKYEEGVSQASIGFFIRSTAGLNDQYADWIMDFENHKLRFTLGQPDEPDHLQLFSLADRSYVVERMNRALVCLSVPVTFQDVIGAYLYPYVRYIGDSVINNQTYRMFAGVSPDPITLTEIANIAYVSATSLAFARMPIMTPNGFIYYSFPEVTIGNPEASYYAVPSLCNQPIETCSPACGSNAQCINQTCVCYYGFHGDATIGCVANVSLPQQIGSMNITYDKHLLQVGADAVSQTCIGTYIDPIASTSIYSAWVQNLESKMIRWDIGTPGQSGSKSYYFLPDVTYTVTYASNTCSSTQKTNFSHVFNNMFYPTMRYLDETTYNDQPCRMYAGTGVPNPDTNATSMIKFISSSQSQFYFLAMLNTQGYTYYDYPNVTLGTPATSWFQLPSVCPGSSTEKPEAGGSSTEKPEGGGSSAIRVNPVVLAVFAVIALLSLKLQLHRLV